MLERHQASGFPATILRPAAIYGPCNNIFDMETPMFLRLLRHLPILLPHEGTVTGSYGHVDDLCDLAIAAATTSAAVGHVVNATGEAVSAEGYARTLAGVVGEEPDIVMVPDNAETDTEAPLWSHLFDARHHAVLDTTKAATLLGVEPRFDTAAGHADAYDWFVSRGGPDIAEAEVDPVWRATWDFGAEARLAATLR